jgi:hypothetical protein
MPGDVFMSDPTDCQYNEYGYCKISSDLANAPVPIANDACAACVSQTRPRSKNPVTCSKAIEYLSIVQMPIPQDLLECVMPPTHGVGTELETLIAKTRIFLSWFCLAWIIPTGFTCGCHSTKRRMNELGPRLCMRDGDELSAEILKRWILHVPMIRFIPFVLTIIGFYILRASYIAQSKEKPNG